MTVTVSHQANPEFAWTPANCLMHELSVTEDRPLHTNFYYTVDLWRVDEQGIPRRLVSQRFLHRVE